MNDIEGLLASLQNDEFQVGSQQPSKLIYVKNKEGLFTTSTQERIVNDCVTGKHLEYKYYTPVKEYNEVQDLREDALKYQIDSSHTFAKLIDLERHKEVKAIDAVRDFDSKQYDKKYGAYLEDSYILFEEIDYSTTLRFVNECKQPLLDFINYVSPTEKSVTLNLKGNDVIEVVYCHKDTILCNIGMYREVEGMRLITYAENQLIVKDPVKFDEVNFPVNVPVVLVYGFMNPDDPDDYIEWEESIYGDKEYLGKLISAKNSTNDAVVFGAFRLDSENKRIDFDQFDLDYINGLVSKAVNLL